MVLTEVAEAEEATGAERSWLLPLKSSHCPAYTARGRAPQKYPPAAIPMAMISYKQTNSELCTVRTMTPAFKPHVIGVGTMGAPGAGAPPMFSDSYIARLNFLYTLIILPLPIEPPFTKPSSYASACTLLSAHKRLADVLFMSVLLHSRRSSPATFYKL